MLFPGLTDEQSHDVRFLPNVVQYVSSCSDFTSRRYACDCCDGLRFTVVSDLRLNEVDRLGVEVLIDDDDDDDDDADDADEDLLNKVVEEIESGECL